MTLLFSNGALGVFVVFDICSHKVAAVLLYVIQYGGWQSSASKMRRCIFKHLNSNDVVVGFHVAQTLTALLFALFACRVVYLGAEEAFEKLCI